MTSSSTTGSTSGGLTRFAFYGRCSTEDLQDPQTSLGWQRRAATLLTEGHGAIVEEFFDIGYSRSLPWRRRPEATRLLTLPETAALFARATRWTVQERPG